MNEGDVLPGCQHSYLGQACHVAAACMCTMCAVDEQLHEKEKLTRSLSSDEISIDAQM